MIGVDGRLDADEDHVCARQIVIGGRGAQPPSRDHALDELGQARLVALDGGAAFVDERDAISLDINAGDIESSVGEQAGGW